MPTKKKSRKRNLIRSVTDILEILRDHEDGIYVYRGEDSNSYLLRPKLGRNKPHPDIPWSDAESTLLHDFQRRSIPFLTWQPRSELQWLSLAQHNGLATRLLDWTENPLVALFFALRSQEAENRRVFYALRTDDFVYIDDTENPFSFGKVVLYHPLTYRHASQRNEACFRFILIHL